MMVICKRCYSAKPDDDFYRQRRGRMSICKDCHKSAVTLRSRTNPAVQQYDRERAKLPHRRAKAVDDVKRWRDKHPDLYRAQNAINNAIRDGKIDRVSLCACGATKNVFGIPADIEHPILNITWRCARCHHRGRFAASPATESTITP